MTHELHEGRRLPIWIHSEIDDAGLTPNQMRVYVHLARRAGKGNLAFPSYQSIGDHCFGSTYSHPDTRRKEATKAVAELVKAGLLSKKGRIRPDGGQTSNIYTLEEPDFNYTKRGGEDVYVPGGGDAQIPGGGTPPSPQEDTKDEEQYIPLPEPAREKPKKPVAAPQQPPAPEPEPALPPAAASAVVKGTPHQKMMVAVSAALYGHTDTKLWADSHRSLLGRTAKTLLAGGATDKMVYAFKEWWDKHDWRGKKGQSPTYNQFLESFGKWRAEQSKAPAEPQWEVKRGPESSEEDDPL